MTENPEERNLPCIQLRETGLVGVSVTLPTITMPLICQLAGTGIDQRNSRSRIVDLGFRFGPATHFFNHPQNTSLFSHSIKSGSEYRADITGTFVPGAPLEI